MDQQRTMRIVSQMSSDILECLKFTWDSPERNVSGKMPVLDTQMWVSLESREKGLPEQIGQSVKVTKIGALKRIIMFQLYKKPMVGPCESGF